jgi:SRSO17 transposase
MPRRTGCSTCWHQHRARPPRAPLAADPPQPPQQELAFYRCYAPRQVPLPTLVKVAGRRWTTEENFQAGKGLAGLDEHQVRRWTSWYRWTTLAMLACAFLTISAANEHTRAPHRTAWYC